MATQSSGASSNFKSKSNLNSGAERFLSQAVAHAFDNGWRTAEDFLQHFPPLDLMKGLDSVPDLRGQILTKAVGFHERIARKKSAESAAEDLRIALEEGVSSPAEIIGHLSADQRVLYLAHARLFGFAVDTAFFATAKGGREHERAIDRMMFLLETALGEELITLVDIADGITFATIAKSLPVDDLRKVVESALSQGRNGQPLTEARLLEVVPLRTLVSALPLDLIWKAVILGKVAGPAGFLGGKPVPPIASPKAANESVKGGKVDEPAAPKAAAAEPARNAPSREASAPREPPPRAGARPPNGKPLAGPEPATIASEPSRASISSEIEVEDAEEDSARRRVLERLTGIGRLPPRHQDLSTQILFEIDSMYADLLVASDDEAREEAIRDAFPNEQHMQVALLALLELLEPSIDINDPQIAKADVDSLINVFLIEERDHREKGSQRPSAPSLGSAPPPPAPSMKRTVPPPLPKNPNPNPPPLPGAGFEKTR